MKLSWIRYKKAYFKCGLFLDVDSPCTEFEHGTPLHIAASNLACEAAAILLQHGANPRIKDDLGRTPLGKGHLPGGKQLSLLCVMVFSPRHLDYVNFAIFIINFIKCC